jgi:hypothetical protein
MPDETQNPGADAPAGDTAPTTDAAVGEAAVGQTSEKMNTTRPIP